MIREGVITLIAESEKAHGVHEKSTETGHEVFCQIKSVSRSEFYSAMNVGVKPELVLKLYVREEYEDERLANFEGKRYEIIRTYETDDGGIELILERADGR